MRDVDIVLYDGVPRASVEAVGLEQGVAAALSEEASAAHHRELPHMVEHRVPAHDGDGAPVVLGRGQSQVHDHDQGRLRGVLGDHHVDPLRPADQRRRGVGPLRHRVVDHHRGAEGGGGVGRRRDGDGGDGGGVWGGHDVVPEEVDVGHRRAGGGERNGGEEEEEREMEDGGGGGGHG